MAKLKKYIEEISRSGFRSKQYKKKLYSSPDWSRIEDSNEKQFDALNAFRGSLGIKKGEEFFTSVGGFGKISDKQLAAAKNILLSTPQMKRLVKMAKEMTWQEASEIHMEKVKKREMKTAAIYSWLSSPRHNEYLRSL